jgi:hypothetical protein
MEDLETQINTFRVKYNCLPGDCANATDFFGTTFNGHAVYNGDGDNRINATENGSTIVTGDCLSTDPGSSPNGVGEPTQLFLHLDAGGLGNYLSDGSSSVVGTGFPTASINPAAGLIITCTKNAVVWTQNIFQNSNVIVLGMSPSGGWGGRFYYRLGFAGLGVTWLQTNGINLADGQAIDIKTDDGIANTGRVGAFSGCATGNATYTNPTPATPCFIMLGKRL